MITRTLSERFIEKVAFGTDCFFWMGARVPDGYGMIQVGDRMKRASRVAYELYVGNIPDKFTIDHLCRNRACVNPQHLEAVSNKVNILRGIGPTATNAAKTHCKRGHEFNETNTMRFRTNKRHCRICRNNHQKARLTLLARLRNSDEAVG